MKILCTLLLYLIFGLTTSCAIHKQHDNNTKFTPQELKSDFETITDHIEKDIPNPFYSSSKAAYDSVKQEIYTELNDSMTSIQFYRIVYPLFQVMNDGHFWISPNQKLIEKAEQEDKILYFPFKVMISKNKVFVLENYSSDTLIKIGDEIFSINGQPVKSIITKMRSCNFKSSSQEYLFERACARFFHQMLYILFDYKDKFSIGFKNNRTVSLFGVPAQKFQKFHHNDKPFYSFKILSYCKPKIGYIKITSLIWDKRSRRNILQNFLKKTFKKINDDSISYLIIDIRNNLGGSSVLAKDIFNYITNKPLKTSLEEDYFDKGKLVIDTSTWYFPKEVKNKFCGNTILLTNTFTGSSAHMMAASFKYYHLGILVGQISSEPLYIPGEDKRKILPNTRCVFGYATANFKLPGYDENEKEYLIPDYEVYPDMKILANKKDTMLNFAIGLFCKEH